MTTAADRARTERATQGLATPAGPIGDGLVDARVAGAYRRTSVVLASALSLDSGGPATSGASGDNGAASPHARTAVGEVGTAVGSSSPQLPGRSTHSTQEARRQGRASATTAG